MHPERGPRPPAVAAFEYLFLGSLLVTTANAVALWHRLSSALGTQGAALGGVQLMMTLFGGVLMSLMLCFFVSRRGSLSAMWTLVTFFGFSTLAQFSLPTDYLAILGVGEASMFVAWGLNALALMMLFTADAQKWLKESC
jgi:hypothetical protein